MTQTKILFKGSPQRLVKCSAQSTSEGLIGTLFLDRDGYVAEVYEYLYGSKPKVVEARSTNHRMGYGSRLEDCLLRVDFTIKPTLVGATVSLNVSMLLHTTSWFDLNVDTLPLATMFPDAKAIEEHIKKQLLEIMQNTSDPKELWVEVNKWRRKIK